MRVFITGLCLQGNKGGPAIALSLTRQIEQHAGRCSFTLSVPSAEFDLEQRWSQTFGLPVVADPRLTDAIPFPLRATRANFTRITRWLSAFRGADVIVDMSGVCYVGPPSGSTLAAVGGRFRNFLVARVLRKRFLAWTQSYGPFSTAPIRLMARADLKRQPIVFCRGEDCTDTVRRLLPAARVETYPDVAIALDFDRSWGAAYLRVCWPEAMDRRLVTLSPSAVIYNQSRGSGASNTHVRNMVDLVEHLVGSDLNVLLVPHTLRPRQRLPEACDLAVADLVRDAAECDSLQVLDDDLSPIDLKSIISNAYVHVGARYHSIVAALSSGVPCLSLAWHEKYQDVMRQYGLEKFVWNGVSADATGDLLHLVDSLIAERDSLNQVIVAAHETAIQDVAHNSEEFTLLMRSATVP